MLLLGGFRCGCAGSRASAAASELIVELHRRLGPKLKLKAAKIGAGFVDTCLGHLRVAVSRMRKLRVELWATASTESQGGVGDSVGDDDAVLNDGVGGAEEDEEESEEVQQEEELGGDGQSATRTRSRSGDHHVRFVYFFALVRASVRALGGEGWRRGGANFLLYMSGNFVLSNSGIVVPVLSG